MKKFISITIYILNLSILIASIILEKLTRVKMGVNRYVVAKNIYINNIVNINILKWTSLILLVLSLFIFIFKKYRDNYIKIIILIIICIITCYIAFFNKDIKIYNMFLSLSIINILLAYINLLFTKGK